MKAPSSKRKAGARPEARTLWRAKLRVGTSKDEFLFRDIDDLIEASKTAQQLVDSSTAAEIAGAVLVSVERVAHLWN